MSYVSKLAHNSIDTKIKYDNIFFEELNIERNEYNTPLRTNYRKLKTLEK